MSKTTTYLNKAGAEHGYDVDVAAIVDAVLADPSRAEDAKALLTRKLEAPDVVRIAVPKTAAKVRLICEDAEDDMWDNVPV